tara:strand:- start:127 stop:648 length:522 start_codon:yes stop_codon:yes gene_type:complete
MPLPSPRDGERKSKFMSRCMVDLTAKDEFTDVKQRAAVCASQFDKAESKASVVVQNPWDKNDIYYHFLKSSEKEMDHYFDTKEKALKDAEKLGLKGFHSHKNDDGKTMYMAGPDHKSFMKRHNEILKEKESESSLWENIRKKKERIKSGSGEKMRKKGDKGAPTPDQIKKAKD